MQAALAQGLLPAAGVGVEGVAGIDDDVARLHEGGELLDHGLSGGSGLHHDDGHARGAQGGDEVLQVAGGYEVALGAVALHEPLGTGQGAVEHRHRVPVAGEVARQVGPITPNPNTPRSAEAGAGVKSLICCLSCSPRPAGDMGVRKCAL